MGLTNANILVGVLSALFDNISVMFAVLAMSPKMSNGLWLLVTLTGGVAIMRQARGIYIFFSHLKWTWAIALGYVKYLGTFCD